MNPKDQIQEPARGKVVVRGPRRVLIIEDNSDAADSLKDLLELSAHKVDVAHTGPEGLQKARSLRPELILCDIGLPGMDGYEVARAVRSDDSLKQTRLVALTGYAAPSDVALSLEAGFDFHVAKPPDIDELHRLILYAP